MSFSKLVAMLAAFGFVSLLASVEAENPRYETGLYSVRFVDDSRVIVRLLTEEIEITTAYGNLKVPLADVRRINAGFRYPEGVEKQVESAVAQLGDADSKIREAAGKELVLLSELAYPALRRAVESENQEVKRQALALVRQLEDKRPGDQLTQEEHDVIVTTRFPIHGRVEKLSLKGHSRIFGDVQLQMANIRQVRSLTVDSEAAHEPLEPIREQVRDWTLRSQEPGMYEVRLADGSLVDLRLISKEIEVTTLDGKIKLPTANVRRIDFGFRYPEGVEKQIGAAVDRLGNADIAVHKAAGKELLQLKELAYPALRRAGQSENEEIKQRAAALIRELEDNLPGEQLEQKEDDVIVTTGATITGRIDGSAMKAQTRLFGEVRLQLAEIREMASVAAGFVASQTLVERVSEAVRAMGTTRSQQMGTGTDSYEEVPEGGGLLIGFEVTYGRFGDSPTLTSFRPIFLTRAGWVTGTTHGVPGEGHIRVVAKHGYAVGAVTIKAGLGVDGMSVTFMEICEGGLNPNRAYDSSWLGGMGGGPETKIVGTGAPVVGIFGATAEGISTFNGLGLVWTEVLDQHDSDESKKVKKIELLKGKVTRNNTLPERPIIGVSFDGNSKFTDKFMHLLKPLKSLKMLKLSDLKIGDDGLNDLSELHNLTTLNLSGTDITDEGLKSVLGLKNMEDLELTGTKITDIGVKELNQLTNLRRLWLGGTQITDAGLSELKGLKNLTKLNLCGTQITDDGLKELRALNSLRSLNLNQTQITDLGLRELVWLTNLSKLDLGQTKITDAGLKESLPNVKIDH